MSMGLDGLLLGWATSGMGGLPFSAEYCYADVGWATYGVSIELCWCGVSYLWDGLFLPFWWMWGGLLLDRLLLGWATSGVGYFWVPFW